MKLTEDEIKKLADSIEQKFIYNGYPFGTRDKMIVALSIRTTLDFLTRNVVYEVGQKLVKKLDNRIVTIVEIDDNHLILDGDYLLKQIIHVDNVSDYYTII